MNETHVYHWSELKIPCQKVDKRMLLKSGITMQTKALLKSESPKRTTGLTRFVRFDKSYIAYRLAILLKPIANAPSNVIVDIMQETLLILSNWEDGILTTFDRTSKNATNERSESIE